MRAVSIVTLVVLLAAGAFAQQPEKPTVDEQGTVHGNWSSAPLSDFLSDDAKRRLTAHLRRPPQIGTGIEATRASTDAGNKISLDEWLKIYPSNIEDTTIDGVHVYIVTPKDGVDPANKDRVLLNAHMGGYKFGGKYGGQLEAVPLSGRGRVKVIAVDYRLAPENIFPSAHEDMEKVYRHVLKTTKPENVGVYGCSAGGALTAQSIAWFAKKGLPRPGAASIMCSGAMRIFWFGGDSGTTAPILNAQAGTVVRPATGVMRPMPGMRDYLEGLTELDPVITPGEFPEVLAKFPPTLLVTGTRDSAMSNVLVTHARLLDAGVDAQLFVVEGLGHGHFFTLPGTPESKTTYNVIWKFFDRNLGR